MAPLGNIYVKSESVGRDLPTAKAVGSIRSFPFVRADIFSCASAIPTAEKE